MPKLINVPGVGRVPVPDDYTFEQILNLREQLQKKSGIEPDLTPQFGLGELLGRGFERRVERFKIGFGDVLPAMVGSAFGNEDYAKRQMEEAAASEQALQERLPARYQSYQDVKSLADVPGYVVETIGESAPDVLTSLIPGGVGATVGRIGAQQAARQALMGAARQGAAREVAVKAAQEAAEKSATRGMLAGTYLGSYAQNAPEVFQNIYQETGEFNPTVAALYGGLSAALDSIVPAKVLDQLGTVGKGALIREMVKSSGADPKVWQTIGKGVAKGFATEGLTESAQEFVNNLAVKTLKENYDLFSPENVTRYIDSFLRGAIVGGGISLPSSTLQAVRERNLIKAKEQEEAAKVAESERVKAEEVAAQQKLDQENQILSQIPEGIEPVKVGEDIFTVEKTGAAGDLIPRGYIVSGVQDRQVDTLDQAETLKAAMESTREDDIKNQEEERAKLIEKLAKLDEQLDQKQKDVINISKEDFEAFRDKTYPEQSGKLNEQIAIKNQILDRLNKPIEIKPLEEQVAREADEYTTFKRTPEGQQAISRHVSPEEAKEKLFKPATVEQSAEPVEQVAEPPAEPQLVGKEEVTGQPLEELRKELDRLGLPEVGVKLYNALLDQGTPVDGAFAQQTINIAMNPAKRTRIQTLHHETIHALKEAGLFTAGEWKALSTAAKKDWIKRKWPDLQGKTVADLYADQSPEIQIEEAVAVAFEHYMKKAFSPAGQVSSAFQKIANFFGRIRNLFTGKGYQTADDVFEFISSGAMRYKIRPGEVSIGPTKLAKAPPVDTEEFKHWFGDSKVVDKDGKPQVMYTGTSKDKDFAFFKIPGNGAWFSSNPDEASMYAKENDSMGFKYDPDKRNYVPINTASRVMPVYLSIKNPATLSQQDSDAMRYASNYKKTQTNIFSRLLSEGYDGVDMGGGTWVVLSSPEQIKSAIGNVGAYGQREVTKEEAERVGLTPAQAKAAQKKGDIRFARSPIADMQEAALEKIDAVQSKAQDNGYNLAKSPATAKQGMNVVNQFMNQSPTFGKKVVDRILDMSLNNRSMIYNFLTLEQLADVGKDILPGLTPYYETFQEMAGYRDKQLYYASKIAKRLSDLSRKEPEQTERLADVAHMATIAAFDPDRPGTDKNPEITKLWNGLNGEAKQLYRDMRDFYDKRYKAYYALLQQRIASAITDENKKAEVNAKMKLLFETQRVKGPYFPLSRFGQYWVSYNDGVDRFVMFEKRAEAERFAADLNGKGYKDVKSGLREEYNLNMPVPSSVIKELIDTVDKAGSPQELKRDLWTAYLTMLPEVSMRKHFIPRKGTPGYSNDIQRVFAENTFHGAYNLARLKFAPQFEKAISDMRTTISDANKQGKGNEPGELFNALMKRQNFIMNPTPSNMITEAAGILGFTWFLTAPASAITNLSQNATVAYPVLGARFGFNKAMSEMLGASRLFMSSGERNIDEPFSIIRALEQRVKESSGAEKKAFERELQAMEALMDNGTLTRTQAMDLAAMSDKPSITQNKLNTTLKWVGAMFHGAEVFNRSTTAYAAYRMAFEKTGDQDAAIKEASRLVRRSHFDYSAANKPPILQNDFAKVIFMFKQYGINMTYLLLRESQILLKHMVAKYKGTPLEKEAIERAREARDTLIGTLGVTGLFSGVFGLPYPLYLMTMVIANALFGDEEDEIFDAETRFKLWLTDSLGADAADIIAKGPISYLSGADFSEKVSANGLIFKDIGRLGPRQAEEVEQKEATMQWLVDVMGPIGGLAMNFSKGLGAMNSGNVYQGIEQMVPLPIANGMKAIRYASEGVLTMKGDPIVEEINSYQTFLRAIGYAPTEIARQLEENTSIRAVESQATLSRKQLLNRFALAVHTGDTDALEDIEAAIERFNEKFEGYEITGETLSQSLKAREAARAEVEHGLRINKRIRDVYERGARLND